MRSLTILVPGPFDARTGGYEYDRRIAAGLRERGWSVEVCELDASFPRPTSTARQKAIAVLRSIPGDRLVLADGLAFGALPEEAAREAGRLRFVALVHHPLAAETGLSAADADALETSERRALASARLVVVTSAATAAAVASYGVPRDRVVVVEPGTESAPIAAGSGTRVVQLVCVAALVPRKGHEVLFRALAEVEIRHWRLACVGSLDRDRAHVASLRDQIHALNLDDRITLAGELQGDVLSAAYHAADVFVLPTLYEGYGMAVAEALARGLPVVSTPTGGIADLLASGAGILVPSRDAGALARALDRVLADGVFREALAAGARSVRGRLPRWQDAAERMSAALDGVARDAGAGRAP